MILMMFCVGGDDGGTGVWLATVLFLRVLATPAVFVGDTKCWKWWFVGAGIGGEFDSSLTIRLMAVAIMVGSQ